MVARHDADKLIKHILHIVTDNLSAHKTKEVYDYLNTRPKRFMLHFIPTHSSWLNLVERWFAEITNKQIALVLPVVYFKSLAPNPQ